MEKMMWTQPRAGVEQFAANEYTSICFYIECAWGGSYHNGYHTDSSGYDENGVPNSGCGNLLNQAISVISGDIRDGEGATISIVEKNCVINGTYVGDLDCYFVADENTTSNRQKTLSGVKVGDTIYWVTNVGAAFGWESWMNHKGTVTYNDANRPGNS